MTGIVQADRGPPKRAFLAPRRTCRRLLSAEVSIWRQRCHCSATGLGAEPILSTRARVRRWATFWLELRGPIVQSADMMRSQPGHRFCRTRVRPGYDMVEVDQFIDRIEGTLGLCPLTGGPVSADDVRTVRFRTVRLRWGYDEVEVDRALDQYQQQLAGLPPSS